MSLFHRHTWTEMSRTFTPPRDRAVDIRGQAATFERAIYGFTTILFRCSGCGEVKERLFLGRIEATT